jgi:hypothetical protein
MAFDSTTSQTLSNPTLVFTTGDWNVAVTISNPTFVGTLNDFTVESTLSLPTFTSSADLPYNIIFGYTLPNITVEAILTPSQLFALNNNLRLPSLDFSVGIPKIYQLSLTLPNIAFNAIAGITPYYTLQNTFKAPRIDFRASLVATTIKQTWAFNTITTAHSRYTNYDFDSFFKIGTKQFGINTSGIYEITGDKDFSGESNQSQINAQITLPASAFGEQVMKQCSDAIIYGRTDGDIEVVVTIDESEQFEGFYIISDDRTGMHRRRVKIPKGLKGNVWQYTIKNVDGSAFDLNAFEVFLRPLQRIKW